MVYHLPRVLIGKGLLRVIEPFKFSEVSPFGTSKNECTLITGYNYSLEITQVAFLRLLLRVRSAKHLILAAITTTCLTTLEAAAKRRSSGAEAGASPRGVEGTAEDREEAAAG